MCPWSVDVAPAQRRHGGRQRRHRHTVWHTDLHRGRPVPGSQVCSHIPDPLLGWEGWTRKLRHVCACSATMLLPAALGLLRFLSQLLCSGLVTPEDTAAHSAGDVHLRWGGLHWMHAALMPSWHCKVPHNSSRSATAMQEDPASRGA